MRSLSTVEEEDAKAEVAGELRSDCSAIVSLEELVSGFGAVL